MKDNIIKIRSIDLINWLESKDIKFRNIGTILPNGTEYEDGSSYYEFFIPDSRWTSSGKIRYDYVYFKFDVSNKDKFLKEYPDFPKPTSWNEEYPTSIAVDSDHMEELLDYCNATKEEAIDIFNEFFQVEVTITIPQYDDIVTNWNMGDLLDCRIFYIHFKNKDDLVVSKLASTAELQTLN